MKGRFQRGKVAGISPFFAFQDIITSAMAVIITIVMLLALDMGEPTQGSSGEPDRDHSLTKQLQKLLDELSQANAKLRIAQDVETSSKLDPELLKGQVDTMRAELARIQGLNAAGSKNTSNTETDGAAIVWEELEKQKAAVSAARKQLAQRESEVAGSLAEMKSAEENLRKTEGKLLSERGKKNELWLIPDRSKTSKEPVLVVVTAAVITLSRFDQSALTEISGSGLTSKFETALKSYSKLDQYVVFYFKPSGVRHFEKLTGLAKSSGFEIGYDAVDEQAVINFNASP